MTAFGLRASGLRVVRVVLVMVAFGTGVNSAATVLLYRANQRRANEICELVLNTHKDRVKRLGTTIAYLKTPAGREHTALNDYIRASSLPQLRAEVLKERRNLPPTCVAGRSLPPIPR